MYDVAIIIINYKTPEMTRDSVRSVVPQLSDNMVVVIVDNFSDDGESRDLEEWASKEDPRILFIQSPTNSGFSGGNNLGFRHVDAQSFVLLNSDTYLREGALARLIEAASHDSSVGMVSPRLEWPDSTPQISVFRFHSPLSEFSAAASNRFTTRLLSRWVVARPVVDHPTFCQWTSFACILIKKEVIASLGLMDEGYFLYYEDVDFCRRARNAGWKILHEPSARVVHLRGGSSDTKKRAESRKRAPRYVYESRARYFKKFYGGRIGLIFVNLCWLAGRLMSKSAELLGKKTSPICENQTRDIWIGLK